MHLLRRDFNYHINHKKIYRLCKKLNILLSKNQKKFKINRKVSENRKITRPNQLWQFDIKVGYIHGENRHFYLLGVIDVFDKTVVGYHIGLSCKARDLKFVINEAIKARGVNVEDLVIRSDNGPQMTSNQFNEYVLSIGLEHEFIPVRCPNKNAFIESFFSIFETQFLQVHYFRNFYEVYVETEEFINFYNTDRLHGSLGYLSPVEFNKKFNEGLIIGKLERC